MLFGKLFTTFALAAMTISHVACAPTAEPETAAIQKRSDPRNTLNSCHSDVSDQCNGIDNWLSQHNYQVDADNCGELETLILAICDRISLLCVDLKAEITLSIDVDVLHDCGNIFISIVNLLCTLLSLIFKCCTADALPILLSCVQKLCGEVQTCYTIIRGCCEGLLGGLLGLILGLLSALLGNLDSCFHIFISICGYFGPV